MSDDFEASIKRLAESAAAKTSDNSNKKGSAPENDTDIKNVLEEFLKVSQKGADIYNKARNLEELKVYELPSDFLEVFLGIPGRNGGLSFVSENKLAVFFDEDPSMITVIGKMRNNKDGIQTVPNKSLKLLQISFSKSETGYLYKDNTGDRLSCEGAVAAVIGWLVS